MAYLYEAHICTFSVTFFSATIDGRDLIFGYKLHIGTLYRGKRCWTHQIPTSCLPTLLIFIHIEMGPKTLPTIWATYMKLVTKYQISAINSCWEKCDEKWTYMFNVYKNQQNRQTGSRNLMGPKTPPTIWGFRYEACDHISDLCRRIFLSKYWWQKSDIWSQASYRYAILWVAFFDPSDSYFLFADLVGFYTHWTYMHIFRHIFLSNYWWHKSEACDQISDFCHQYLLRKMRRKISIYVQCV
jgi:hypothetical protein